MDDVAVLSPDQADRCTFRILYVCTGNLCRSPFAEILTRHLLAERLGSAAVFQVESAGVQAVVGARMHGHTRGELAPWNLHREAASRFVARQLEPSALSTADLVLGMTAGHRAAAVEVVPQTLATAFTLREFARLSTQVAQSGLPTPLAERAREVVRRARGLRSSSVARDVHADDVPDPIGMSREAHHEVAVMVRSAIEVIVSAIAPCSGTVPAQSVG